MNKKLWPATGEQIDDVRLKSALLRLADESELAATVLDLISRREDQIERLELMLARIASGRPVELSSGLACLRRDPMARFKDDVRPAVTNARIAVHNAKIMGRVGSGSPDHEG